MTTRNSKNRITFVSRRALATLLCLGGLVLAFIALRNAAAQGQSQDPPAVQGVYQGLSPVVKFDISPPLRDMAIILPGPGQLRENEDRDIVPLKVRFAPEWDPVVQPTVGGRDLPGGTEIPGPIVIFQWPVEYQRRCATRSERRSGSKPHRHDVQPELPDLQQNRHLALWSGSKQHALGRLWRFLSDFKLRRSGRSLRSRGRSLVALPVHRHQRPFLELRCDFAD